MCVPTIFIREDGKGFVVRKGGFDFDLDPNDEFVRWWVAEAPGIYKGSVVYGLGDTIMEAVDSALQKVRAAENKGGGSR